MSRFGFIPCHPTPITTGSDTHNPFHDQKNRQNSQKIYHVFRPFTKIIPSEEKPDRMIINSGLHDKRQHNKSRNVTPKFICKENVSPFGKYRLFGRLIFAEMPSCRRIVQNENTTNANKGYQNSKRCRSMMLNRIVIPHFGITARKRKRTKVCHDDKKIIHQKNTDKTQTVKTKRFCFL